MDYNTAYMNFITYLKIKKYSDRTILTYRTLLKQFKEFLETKGIEDVRQVTKEDMQACQEEIIRNRKLSVSTKRIRIQAIRQFYSHLASENHILINPCEGFKPMPAGYRLPKVLLTPKEMERILNAPNLSFMIGIRDRAILELLYSTGIRVGECSALTVYAVDTKERLVNVRHGKWGKDRVVPMGSEAAKWIKEYLQMVRPRLICKKQHTRTLFLTIGGDPVRDDVLREMIQRYIKKAKIRKKGITCHTIRHTFATELLKNGADIVSIQKLLGHKNIKSTLIYTRVVPVDVKHTHQKTHPRGK